IMATTGACTGRSLKDRFVVKDEERADKDERGSVNLPIEEDKFDKLYQMVICHLSAQEELLFFKGFAGADDSYRIPVEVINEYAWHNLFARQLFITPTEEELENHVPGFTVINAPTCLADPEKDGTNSEAFVLISFKKRIVLIG